MKQPIIIIFLFLCTLSARAQHSVFVLVDVSKSIAPFQLTDAKQALTEVLNGSGLSKAFVSQGTQQDLAQFRLAPGDSISISKFGGLNTTLAIMPNPVVVQNTASGTDQLVNSIEWAPTDNETYIILAKAKIAEYAKKHGINNYRLYVISDNIQDDYGPNGRPNYPDDYTRNLVEGYNSSTNGVQESGYTKIKFAPNSLYTLSFSPGVNINKYVPGSSGGPTTTQKPPQSIPPATPTTPVITLTSFADGKKGAPKSANANSFTISWTCNCAAGTSYYVLLAEADGGKYKEQKKNLTANSVKFNDVPSGIFKITVSASSASSAITFVETPGGGAGWIIFLLIALAAGGASYYFWNKKRRDKIDKYATSGNDDIFSGRSNSGSTNSSSSNSEYF